jgi:hypothetical protein
MFECQFERDLAAWIITVRIGSEMVKVELHFALKVIHACLSRGTHTKLRIIFVNETWAGYHDLKQWLKWKATSGGPNLEVA